MDVSKFLVLEDNHKKVSFFDSLNFEKIFVKNLTNKPLQLYFDDLDPIYLPVTDKLFEITKVIDPKGLEYHSNLISLYRRSPSVIDIYVEVDYNVDVYVEGCLGCTDCRCDHA